MSNLRQGVLRAVRLLPEVVKIGIETETALSSVQGEEQLLNEEVSAKKEETTFTPPDPMAELNERIAALQKAVDAAEASKRQSQEKISALEAELAGVRDAATRREREMAAEVRAAGEQARAEGSARGHAEGLENGYKAGLEKVRAEIETQYRDKFANLVAALEGVSAKLEENFAELVALNQPRMLRLWQEMLEKMLQRETTLTPDAVLKVLADVLSRLSDKNHVLIYVSPEDLALLEDRMHGEFEDILRGVKHLELKPDTNVDRGSCLVETNLGVYDARWRTQLEQIDSAMEKLFRKLGKAPGEDGKRGRKKTEEAAAEPVESAKKKTTRKAAPRKKALGPNTTFVKAEAEEPDA